MRYPEIADDLVVVLKRVGQKALKVRNPPSMNSLIFTTLLCLMNYMPIFHLFFFLFPVPL